MAEPPSAQRTVALVALALMLVHATVGFLPWVPLDSWQMYVAADRYTYTLHDRAGRPVDLAECVSADSYLINHQLPPVIAQWLAQARPELAPLTGTVSLEVRGEDGPATRTFDFTAETGKDVRWEPRD